MLYKGLTVHQYKPSSKWLSICRLMMVRYATKETCFNTIGYIDVSDFYAMVTIKSTDDDDITTDNTDIIVVKINFYRYELYVRTEAALTWLMITQPELFEGSEICQI